MTRDEIEALTPDALAALLAERVMGWRRVIFGGAGYVWETPGKQLNASFNPTRDRNELAKLVAAVHGSVLDGTIGEYLGEEWPDSVAYSVWLLTCDPLIICRAVALAVCGGEA